jgi:hypothetical protein
MFKFAEDIPFQALAGQYVWWACFSISGGKITLDDGNEIVIFNIDQFFVRNDWRIDEGKRKFAELPGNTILQIEIISEDELTIEFSNGTKIRFVDLEMDFENYQFVINSVGFIV